MPEIGIGIVGGGYMGKAHSVAMASVASVFDTKLRPRLEVVAASSPSSAEKYRDKFGFRRAAADWRDLVADPKVEAIVIASPQWTHREIAEAAFARGLHVLCEKPLGGSIEDGEAMVAAAKASGCRNMVGFNYIRTPATQFARKLIEDGRIGELVYFRGEHTEDFDADPDGPATWRSTGVSNGNLGDLAPHIINAAHTLIGPIRSLIAEAETVHKTRGEVEVTNDDQAQIMCRFDNGVMGHLFSSRVATGRKMGYAYEVHGTKGAIRFDQEDQNAIWLYLAEGPEAERGFRKVLTGPAHPDYLGFCQGPGHGTGYQDQIIIEAKHFLDSIATGEDVWPSFEQGQYVNKVVHAALASNEAKAWVTL
ncbi:MAG: Gfo/Idh/MocA family oxidoreductase [Litoreibacter sp.]|nr:Gfo/Idh/MocA family oxidoreductase [Litoreibacter sp.]